MEILHRSEEPPSSPHANGHFCILKAMTEGSGFSTSITLITDGEDLLLKCLNQVTEVEWVGHSPLVGCQFVSTATSGKKGKGYQAIAVQRCWETGADIHNQFTIGHII